MSEAWTRDPHRPDEKPGDRAGAGAPAFGEPATADLLAGLGRAHLFDATALDEAGTILRFVESLNAVEDLQTLLDRLAEGVALTAGWNVAVMSVYLPEGGLLGSYHLPADERARFVASMARTPLASRLAKRAKIHAFAFPGTGIAYVPHTEDLSRSLAFAPSRAAASGTWHPDDRLFVFLRTGTGQEIGVLSLDEPLDGMAPTIETLGPLRVVERLLALGASLLQERVLARDLKRREEDFRELVDGAPVGIYRSDAGGRMLSANPRLAEIFGYATADALVADAAFVELLDPADYATVLEPMAAGREVRAADLRARRRDGTPIRLRMTLRRDAEGVVHGIVEDVTEARRLEEHLLRAQRLEAIGTLASGVAHDFNNLLAGILGYASLLEQRLASDPSLGPMARGIQDAALRAAELTRGLLGVARPSAAEPLLADVARVLGDVARIAHETFDRRIVTTVRADADLPPARVGAGELHRAILNLAINARDALPEGGEIALVAELDAAGPRTAPSDARGTGPWLRVDVRDTGVGMSQAVRVRLFEPFFTTKPRGKGTGLGLYGVYQFLRAFGGAVEVDSRPAEGTTFRVYLPRPPDPRPSRRRRRRRARGGPPRGARILVVEDEDAVRRVAGALLHAAGYEVVEAVDGEEAVRRFAETPLAFDLVLLDLMLPRLSGKEVLRRVRALRPDVPVLLSSGNVHEGLDDPEVRAGVRGSCRSPTSRATSTTPCAALARRPRRDLGAAGGRDSLSPRPRPPARSPGTRRHHGEADEQGPREGSDPP